MRIVEERKRLQRNVEKSNLRKLKNEYEEYVKETYDSYFKSLSEEEKEIIDNQINKELDENFKEKIKGTRVFMYEARKGEIIKEQIELIKFDEFCEHREIEKDQLPLFNT